MTRRRTAVAAAYWHCIRDTADLLATTSAETADVVAIAVLATCHRFEAAITALFQPQGLDLLRAKFKDGAIQRIVFDRVAASQASRAGRTKPDSMPERRSAPEI